MKSEDYEKYMSVSYKKGDDAVKIVGYRVCDRNRLVGFAHYVENGDKMVRLTAEEDFARIIEDYQAGVWARTGRSEAEWLEGRLRRFFPDEDQEKLREVAPDPKHPLDLLVDAIIKGEVWVAERSVPECLEDYPGDVQREAEEIVRAAEAGEIDLFEWFLDVLDEIHVGDRREKALALLSVATLFVENTNPVHQAVKGQRGSGKTHMILSVAKAVPERFVHVIRSSSPLYLFYASDEEDQTQARMKCRDDYNIYIFDDIRMNEVITDIAKFLTDNQLKEKIHRTVIDQKPREFKIPGEGLVFFTRAQSINDAELNDRLLYNNPQESAEHKREQLEFVRRQTSGGEDGFADRRLQVARAVFEHLITEPIRILNPWVPQLKIEDYRDTGPREVERLVELIKAVTFYRQFQRRPIYQWNILLGTKEDLETALEVFKAVDFLQRYQLDKAQVRLLEMLPALKKDQEEPVFLEDAPTYRELAQKLNVSSDTVWRWVRGRSRTSQPNLSDRGLVEARSANPDDQRSTHHLYLTEKGAKLLETTKEQKILLGFRFKGRRLNDRAKEEAITTAFRLADNRIPPTTIQKIIQKAKKSKTWKEAVDDRTLYKLMKSIEEDYTHERLKIMRKTREPTTTELKEQIHEEVEKPTEKLEKRRKKEKGRKKQIKLADYQPETIIEAIREAERTKKPTRKATPVSRVQRRRQKTLADFHPDLLTEEGEEIPEARIEEPDLRVPPERIVFKTKTEKKVYDFIRQQSRRNREELGHYGCLDVEIEEHLDMKPELVKSIVDRLEERGMIVNRGGWLQAKEPEPSTEKEEEQPQERREKKPLDREIREELAAEQGEESLAGITEQEAEGGDLAGVSELAQQVYEFIKEHNERHAGVEEYMGCHRFKISDAFDVPEKKLDEALIELEKRELIVRHLEFFALKELEPAFWIWSL